jgi:hypothetical protein
MISFPPQVPAASQYSVAPLRNVMHDISLLALGKSYTTPPLSLFKILASPFSLPIAKNFPVSSIAAAVTRSLKMIKNKLDLRKG